MSLTHRFTGYDIFLFSVCFSLEPENDVRNHGLFLCQMPYDSPINRHEASSNPLKALWTLPDNRSTCRSCAVFLERNRGKQPDPGTPPGSWYLSRKASESGSIPGPRTASWLVGERPSNPSLNQHGPARRPDTGPPTSPSAPHPRAPAPRPGPAPPCC